MESLSFLFIAVGAILALVRRLQLSGGRVKRVEFLAFLTIIMVALLSWSDVFIGPIGDARRYHETINACFASVPPCGDKLHEQVWGLASAVIGPAWGLVYGFTISSCMALVARASGLSWRSPVMALLFLYSAYQIGNGMAEGTFFLLLLVGVIAAQAYWMNNASLAFLGAFIGHLGNAPFILYLLQYPRGWPLAIAGIGTGLVFLTIALDIRIEDLTSIVNKAGALMSQETARLAIETKANVSVRDADTSYADQLFAVGFPFSTHGFTLAVWLYVVPIVTGGGAINLAISTLSTLFSLVSFWLARHSVLLTAIVIFSILLFAPASFTPGIGLRHKVPLFLFLLMARDPARLRELAWHR